MCECGCVRIMCTVYTWESVCTQLKYIWMPGDRLEDTIMIFWEAMIICNTDAVWACISLSAHTSTRTPGKLSETVACVASAGWSWEAWLRLCFLGGRRHSRGACRVRVTPQDLQHDSGQRFRRHHHEAGPEDFWGTWVHPWGLWGPATWSPGGLGTSPKPCGHRAATCRPWPSVPRGHLERSPTPAQSRKSSESCVPPRAHLLGSCGDIMLWAMALKPLGRMILGIHVRVHILSRH